MTLKRWAPPIVAIILAIIIANRLIELPLVFSFFLAMFLFFFSMLGMVANEKRNSVQDLNELAKESIGTVRQTFAVAAFAFLKGTKKDKSLKLTLVRAGMSIKPIQIILLGFFGSLILSGALFFLLGNNPVGLVGLLIVPAVIYGVINVKARKRVRSFDEALPILLRTISAGMLSGRSFEQSLDSSAKNSDDEPVNTEIGYAMSLISAGQDSSIVYRRLAERMDSAGFELLSQAYQVTKSTGARLEGILNSVANSIEARHQLEALIRALSAEGKLSAAMISAMPFLIYFAMRQLNPEYASLLTADIRGWGMIVGALLSTTIGLFWIKNLITFKD